MNNWKIGPLEAPPRRVDSVEQRGGIDQVSNKVLGGGAIVEVQSSDEVSLDLRIVFDGPHASRRCNSLAELGRAPTMQPVAVRAVADPAAGINGYYALSAGRRPIPLSQPEEGHDSGGWEELSPDLTRIGTRSTHWLAVDTSITQPEPGHEFGNSTEALVGIPADARRARIVDSTSSPSERERPDPVDTVEAEHGAVDLYDATAEPIENPIYLYDLPYDKQGDVDADVWDTYGHDAIRDEDDVVTWGRVFDTAHEFGEGAIVLENGLLRITIDEPTNADETATLEVEQWDADEPAPVPGTGLYGEGLYGDGLYAGTRGDWVAVDLPAYDDGAGELDTEWKPVDVDLVRIGQARVVAQVEFEATAGAAEGDVYAVDVQLERGRETLGVWETTGSLPGDLAALLDPIASTSIFETGVSQTVVAREEVRP